MRRLAALLAVLATFAATATAEAKRLVRYDVNGGLAGVSDRLLVARDGTARQSGNRSGDDHRFMVSPEQLRGLRRDLKAARVKTLKRTYRPDYVVNDGIAETVTYKGRSVSVYTGATFPVRLHRLLRRLGRLMRAPSARGSATPHGCPGPLLEQVRGTTWMVHSIRAMAMSCDPAARLIRRFLRKADAKAKCYRASKRPPPTRGCAVGRFHCWRRDNTKYCARRGHDVSWRETRR